MFVQRLIVIVEQMDIRGAGVKGGWQTTETLSLRLLSDDKK
jgi:hypothetical protein